MVDNNALLWVADPDGINGNYALNPESYLPIADAAEVAIEIYPETAEETLHSVAIRLSDDAVVKINLIYLHEDGQLFEVMVTEIKSGPLFDHYVKR